MNSNNKNRNNSNNLSRGNQQYNNNLSKNNNYFNNNFKRNGNYATNNRNYNFTNSNSNQFTKMRNNPDANVRCFYCHKLGHRMQDCKRRMRSEQNKKETGMTAEENVNSEAFTLMATTNEENIPTEHITIENQEQWFGDSGASVHITNNDVGMFNVRSCESAITIGDGSQLKCEIVGDLKVKVLQRNKNKKQKEIKVKEKHTNK